MSNAWLLQPISSVGDSKHGFIAQINKRAITITTHTTVCQSGLFAVIPYELCEIVEHKTTFTLSRMLCACVIERLLLLDLKV